MLDAPVIIRHGEISMADISNF